MTTTRASGVDAVLPSSADPVVAGTVTAIGGPPGRHSRLGRPGFWTPVRWIVLLTLVFSLFGWWQKSPCRVQSWEENYQYTRGCYTDVFALYFAEGLVDGDTPYLEHPVEYPVVIGGVMAVAAEVVRAVEPDQRPRRFYDVTWAILTGFAVVVAITTARLAGRRRPWDAALFAAAPLLILHGSTNWDLVAMALTGLGLVQWSRRRPLAAGVLLGLATATKLYPVLFLVPLFALCLRAGRLKAFAATALALVITPVVLSLPVYLNSPYFADLGAGQQVVAASPLDRLGDEGLGALAPTLEVPQPDGTLAVGVNAAYRFFQLNTTRPADWDSLWYALQEVSGAPLDTDLAPGEAPGLLNRGVALAFLLLLGAIVALVLKAPRRPRLAPVLFLTVLAFLLTNKVWSPQFSLWLLPLLVLARPSWRSVLAWQAAEALVLFTRYYFFADGIAVEWFLTAVLIRDGVLVAIAVLVVRDVLRPELDVVRQGGVDDPMGGELADLLDRERTPVPV